MRCSRLRRSSAGELLGLSERHFRRLRDAYEDRGEEGLIDRRRGRVSSTRVPDVEAEWLGEMFRRQYFDFTAKRTSASRCWDSRWRTASLSIAPTVASRACCNCAAGRPK